MLLIKSCTGEGSAQETIQDISTIIRLGLTPILFVLNNKVNRSNSTALYTYSFAFIQGYTIERFIHGQPQAPFIYTS